MSFKITGHFHTAKPDWRTCKMALKQDWFSVWRKVKEERHTKWSQCKYILPPNQAIWGTAHCSPYTHTVDRNLTNATNAYVYLFQSSHLRKHVGVKFKLQYLLFLCAHSMHFSGEAYLTNAPSAKVLWIYFWYHVLTNIIIQAVFLLMEINV